MPGGELVPHMSARYRTQMMDAIFEGAGGFQKALDWVEKSDSNYGEFFKLWARGQARATSTELTAGSSIEDMLARLDGGEHATLVGSSD